MCSWASGASVLGYVCVLGYGGAWGACSRVSSARVLGYGRAWGACSRVSGARVCLGVAEPGEHVVGHQVRVCAWVWQKVRVRLGLSELEERAVRYQARVCLGMARGEEPVGCVVGYRARVCLGMAEPVGCVVGIGRECAWVWWSLWGV